MTNKVDIRLVEPAEKATQTKLDTIAVTPELAKGWKSPPFQRPLRVNEKVIVLSQEIKESQVIPGVLTLAVLNRETYLLDGQHRREAFLLSKLAEAYVDVRIHHFKTLGDMGEEYVALNSSIVALKPDDIMRGLEPSVKAIAEVRKWCPFVGYDQIRRSSATPVLSMSAVVRCWAASGNEVPSPGSKSVIRHVENMTEQDTSHLVSFLKLAHDAWGSEPEYHRLWCNLNMSLCMWIYRRVVLEKPAGRATGMTPDQFKKCLMALSASGNYVDWLHGRNTTERDRSPAFKKIKSIFVKRLSEETGKPVKFMAPSWASH